MPSASVSMATRATPGFRLRMRAPKRKSARNTDSQCSLCRMTTPFLKVSALTIGARVFPTKLRRPRGSVVGRLLPGLLNPVRINADHPHLVQDRLAFGTVACAAELSYPRRNLAIAENVYPTRVVCEHAVPGLFFRTVSEHVLARMTSASVPVLH